MKTSIIHQRRAISEVISTVILSSVLLIIMIAASFLASDVLSVQMSASEFQASQGLVNAIEREINKMMFKQSSASTIKVSFSATAPGFTKTGQNMNISFSGSPPMNYSVPVNILFIDGRQEIGGNFGYNILGDSSLLVSPYNGSFARISVTKPSQWRVSLDYERALYTNTGITSLFNGTDYNPTNTLEISAIVLDFGGFHPSSNSLILVQNTRILTDTFVRQGNFQITVSTPSSSQGIYLNTIQQNPADSTLVRFHRIYIQISVQEGS